MVKKSGNRKRGGGRSPSKVASTSTPFTLTPRRSPLKRDKGKGKAPDTSRGKGKAPVMSHEKGKAPVMSREKGKAPVMSRDKGKAPVTSRGKGNKSTILASQRKAKNKAREPDDGHESPPNRYNNDYSHGEWEDHLQLDFLTKAEKPMATGETTVVQQNKKLKQPKVELTKNISSYNNNNNNNNNNSPLPLSSKIHRPTTVDDALLSDSKYAEELQLQDVILLSLTEDYVTINHSTSEKEIGGPSQYLCDICADQRANDQMFVVPKCTHCYCKECIIKYVSIKLQGTKSKENVFFFTCPAGADCKGVLELDACRRIMPNQVVAMWEDVMCESLIVTSQKFYCPFKDCSGLIVNDTDEQKVIIRESECPFCHRLFCAQCKVPWHSGYECEEFSKLGASDRGREDLMVYELAKKKKWQRCPRCKFIAEKLRGCLHISCRCGYHFCYRCGGPFDYATHGACKRPRQ